MTKTPAERPLLRSRPARVVLLALFAGALGAACSGQPSAPSGSLSSIAVTPTMTLAIQTTQQFVAVGRDADGAVVSISPTWSVDVGGGSIDGTGLFTAGTTPGTFTSTVKATSGQISGMASVKVINGAVVSVSISHTERESQ